MNRSKTRYSAKNVCRKTAEISWFHLAYRAGQFASECVVKIGKVNQHKTPRLESLGVNI